MKCNCTVCRKARGEITDKEVANALLMECEAKDYIIMKLKQEINGMDKALETQKVIKNCGNCRYRNLGCFYIIGKCDNNEKWEPSEKPKEIEKSCESCISYIPSSCSSGTTCIEYTQYERRK